MGLCLCMWMSTTHGVFWGGNTCTKTRVACWGSLCTGLPVRPCTNEQTVVLLLSCCPILAPSTSPACLLASPSSSQGCAGRWILMELHYLGNFCEMQLCFMLLLVGKALEKIPNHPRVDGNNTFLFHLFVPSASQSLLPPDSAVVLKTYLSRR